MSVEVPRSHTDIFIKKLFTPFLKANPYSEGSKNVFCFAAPASLLTQWCKKTFGIQFGITDFLETLVTPDELSGALLCLFGFLL